MSNNASFIVKMAISFLPFILLVLINGKANLKTEERYKQYLMPIVAIVYCLLLLVFMNQLKELSLQMASELIDAVEQMELTSVADFIDDLRIRGDVCLILIAFNTAALLLFVLIKRCVLALMGAAKVQPDSFAGSVAELFYSYDESDGNWYIKENCGQARTFIMAIYGGCCVISCLALLLSCAWYMDHKVSTPFYPVFAIIAIGEIAFFVNGLEAEGKKSALEIQADKSRHVTMYPLLRKPLRALFGDKLSAEGTTVNSGGISGGSVEDILVTLEKEGGHIGKNYAAFIRRKMDRGLKPNMDYVRCGYELASGKSLLFNTPFYDKLNPYVFYAMNRELLTGGKVLIVLGRHGTEEDLQSWTNAGISSVSNIPDMWQTVVLSGKKPAEYNLPDIGIITRSGVHDLDIHKNNLEFLRKVSFVFVVEPSRLVTTAQIGLNLLIKCCGKERDVTFCSVDRNCDGLVDALSHILMTNITEVSATEYPHGMSSYMYWTADDDYLQHRILPGVSRCLGMGTEFSLVALKNQVQNTVWYGGEAYPVLDAHWIAKQYYYDLLDFAQLPTTQETFDKRFRTSFNMCDERVRDYSYITVEDDRNNLFETRRNFATIAEKQGFVNVISSEYMLREYMSANPDLFTADAKAIPYITADYARTKRNAILSTCLLLCISSVLEETLIRQMVMLNIDTKDPASEIWKELCAIFSCEKLTDKRGTPILSVKERNGSTVHFERDSTILFKREYSIDTGKFENVYAIENPAFSRIILDDLQNASYIAEQESKDVYIGTELKGHVYQKYMPGQLFTLSGKYYEMVSTAADNSILVRRASDHIGGRLAYRQLRRYTVHHLEDDTSMGALKSVNNIDIHYQLAEFSVDTPGYWKLRAHNDFDNGDLIRVNGVPVREYHNKQVLKFDFSKLGDLFTDSVRMTLTNLLNEVFVTLFADNQAFISAVTPGIYYAPLTYSMVLDEGIENAEKCIFIIEDSQLDIGLLVAVERNVNRIMQIITDYLIWNEEQIEASIRAQNAPAEEKEEEHFDVYHEDEPQQEKKKLVERVRGKLKLMLDKIKKKLGIPVKSDSEPNDGLTPKQRRKIKKLEAQAKRKEAKDKKAAKKQAEKEQKAAQKQEEALRKAEEKAIKDAQLQAEKEQKAAQKQEEALRKAEEKAIKDAQLQAEKEQKAAQKQEEALRKAEEKAIKDAQLQAEKEQKAAQKQEEKLRKAEEKAAKEAQAQIEKEQKAAQKQEEALRKAEEKATKRAQAQAEKEQRAAQKQEERLRRVKESTARKVQRQAERDQKAAWRQEDKLRRKQARDEIKAAKKAILEMAESADKPLTSENAADEATQPLTESEVNEDV